MVSFVFTIFVHCLLLYGTLQLEKQRLSPAGYRTVTECLGFGFDAKTNDYKIIHLFTLYDPHDVEIFKLGRGIPQKEVYSSSANSWRKVDGSASCFVCSVFPSTCINGMVSWIAAIEDREKLLLSFNTTDEVFLETPLQPMVEVKRQKNAFSWSCNFFVLNESTAVDIGTLIYGCCLKLVLRTPGLSFSLLNSIQKLMIHLVHYH